MHGNLVYSHFRSKGLIKSWLKVQVCPVFGFLRQKKEKRESKKPTVSHKAQTHPVLSLAKSYVITQQARPSQPHYLHNEILPSSYVNVRSKGQQQQYQKRRYVLTCIPSMILRKTVLVVARLMRCENTISNDARHFKTFLLRPSHIPPQDALPPLEVVSSHCPDFFAHHVESLFHGLR